MPQLVHTSLLLAGLAQMIGAFQLGATRMHRRVTLASAPEVPAEGDEQSKQEGLEGIMKELAPVPAWAVADAEGNPMKCELNGAMTALFFIDVVDAQAELKEVKSAMPDLPLDVVPFPLSEAFQWWCEDKGTIVPKLAAIKAAGAPDGVEPLGQQVPLFACLEMQAESKEGKPTLPLFFVHSEAKEAMEMALAADEDKEESKDTFKIVSLSLQRAVELLSTVPSTPAFQFVTPVSSSQFVAGYLKSN